MIATLLTKREREGTIEKGWIKLKSGNGKISADKAGAKVAEPNFSRNLLTTRQFTERTLVGREFHFCQSTKCCICPGYSMQ